MKAILSFCFLGIIGLSACVKNHDSFSLTSIKSFMHKGLPAKSVHIQNDSVSLFVEYSGIVKFNADHTSISSISPNGHLIYRNADKELSAENEDGVINFELSDKGREIRTAEQKQQLMKEAYQAIKHTDSIRTSH